MHRVVSDYTGGDTRNNMVKVFVRARPPDEAADTSFLNVGEDQRKITIKDPDENSKKYSEVNFQFDSTFWTDCAQKEVFKETCRPLVDHVIEGYNCCCFAYGQTGSGKTYTMFGEEGEIRGTIPRSVEYLFDVLGKRAATNDIAMVCSFLEIYNDAIRDLGKSYLVAMGAENSNGTALHTKTSDLFASLSGKRGNSFFAPAFKKQQQIMTAQAFAGMPALKEAADEYQTMNNEIREDTDGNVFVKDLSLVPVTSMDEVMSLIASGLRLRATHETKMNAVSSRSHTVFTVTVVQRDKVSEQAISGMLNLVDLAGSERLKKSESVGIRLKEALHINTSLTALGKVVMALDPNHESTHVPYRDSKLTRVLQNSLGGNSHTTLIATILPVPFHYDECLSTLQFANRCRNVTNNPRVNYVGDTEDKDRKIKRLMEELQQMRQKINMLENSNFSGGAGGGGGGGGRGVPPLSPMKLVSILQKLGIKATIGMDGGLVLDGKPVSASVLDIVGGDDDETVQNSRAGSARGAGEVRFGNVVTKASSDKLRKVIAELEGHLKEANTEMDDMRREQDAHVKAIASLTNELTKTQTKAQHKEHTLHAVIAEKDVSLSEMQKRAKVEREKEVQNVVRHNADILNQQNEVLQSYPEAVLKYTKLLKQNKDHTKVMENNLRGVFESHLKTLEKARLAELSNTKQQYEYWIKERDNNLAKFVDGFNRFRTKKTEQLRVCEKEIITIYEYTMKLEEILHDCEQGKYPIQQRQVGSSARTTTGLLMNTGTPNTTGVFPRSEKEKSNPYGGVSIPRAVKSANPLTAALQGAVSATTVRSGSSRPGTSERKSSGHLELSKRIIQKHLERQSKVNINAAGTDNAINVMLATGAEGSIGGETGGMDPEMRAHVLKMLTISANGNDVIPVSTQLGSSRGVVRPTSGKKMMVNTQATTVRAGSVGGDALTPQRPPGAPQDGAYNVPSNYTNVPFSQMAVSTDGDDAGYRREEYVDEISILKTEIENLKNARDQEQVQLETVLEDLQSNETFKYMNFLEQERERMQKQIGELSQQLQYAKVANTSLGRSGKA